HRSYHCNFFFFQAEDGIRDSSVTGVQTCALPISLEVIEMARAHNCGRLSGVVSPMQIDTCEPDLLRDSRAAAQERGLPFTLHVRSEERRVGKECRSRWERDR